MKHVGPSEEYTEWIVTTTNYQFDFINISLIINHNNNDNLDAKITLEHKQYLKLIARTNWR